MDDNNDMCVCGHHRRYHTGWLQQCDMCACSGFDGVNALPKYTLRISIAFITVTTVFFLFVTGDPVKALLFGIGIGSVGIYMFVATYLYGREKEEERRRRR